MKNFIIVSIAILCLFGGIVLYKYNNYQSKPIDSTSNQENNEPVEPSIYDSYNEEEMEYLNKLMGLKHYDEYKIDRYLNYKDDDKYSYEQIIRVVNTNNDLEYFKDANAANIDDDILILVNKYNFLAEDYVPKDLKKIDSNYSYWGELRGEAADAFLTMVTAASKEG